MADNYLFNQHAQDAARLLGESGVEATIVLEVDNCNGTNTGGDLNVALANDDTVISPAPIKNIKLKNFLLYIGNKLSFRFLSISKNLSDISGSTNKATARTNLGVYSTAQTDNAITNAVNLYLKISNAFSELTGQALGTARANLDVYSIAQVITLVKTKYVKLDNFGGDTEPNAVFIPADQYDVISVETTSSLYDWIKMPLLADKPNLYAGKMIEIKSHVNSDTNLNISTTNTDWDTGIGPCYIAKRDAIKLIFNGSSWEILSKQDL